MEASAGFGLRPRTLGELLDLTFRVFRARFRVFAVIGVVVSLVSTAMVLAINAMTWGDVSFSPDATPQFADIGRIYGAAGLSMLVNLLIYSVGSMAVTAAAEGELLGRPLTTGEAVSRSIGRSPAAVVAGGIVGIAVGFGMMLCCLPGIPIAIMLVLAVPLVFLERLDPVRAISRSYELAFKRGPVTFESESSWLRILVVGVVTVVVVYVINIAANLPLLVATGVATAQGKPPVQTPLGPQWYGLHIVLPLQLLGAVLQGMFVAISIIPWTLIYYDIRARYEGVDLENRIADLNEELT